MEFIERRGEAADDLIFGEVGETKQFRQRRNQGVAATVAGELQCNIPRHQGLGSADEQGGTPRLCLWEESDL